VQRLLCGGQRRKCRGAAPIPGYTYPTAYGTTLPRANEFSLRFGSKGGEIIPFIQASVHLKELVSRRRSRSPAPSRPCNPRTPSVMQAACDRCHRRKSRCNKAKPKCGYCVKANAECYYTERSRDPSVRKEYVKGIERRLRQEEAKTQALNSELARLRSLAASRDLEDSGTPQDAIQVCHAV
jgi:hypothetical protein